MSYMYSGPGSECGLPPLAVFIYNNYQEYRSHGSYQQRFKDMEGKTCDQIEN